LFGATPKHQQTAILIGALASALVLGPILLKLNEAGTVYVPLANNPETGFPADFRVDPAQLQVENGQPKSERLQGPQASDDPNSYHVWYKIPLMMSSSTRLRRVKLVTEPAASRTGVPLMAGSTM